MIRQTYITVLLLSLLSSATSCLQTGQSEDYLLSFTDAVNGCGYKNQKGDLVIPPGKYAVCFTDTFRTYAVVVKAQADLVAIDRNENILYKVFPVDNGPDYVSDGLFRIIQDDKIGYADAVSGQIIIKPQFDCAYPFENGIAKVSTDCTVQSEGEHTAWLSDHWDYIDKTGKEANGPKTVD